MKLTKAAQAILLHRLEVPDAIADALGEEWDSDEVEDAAHDLLAAISNGDLPDAVTDVERAVLIDCCEGSTYADSGIGEMPESWVSRMKNITERTQSVIEALPVRRNDG